MHQSVNPLEVVFHKVAYSVALEDFVREQAEKLQKLIPGIQSLRVTIDTTRHRKNHECFLVKTVLSRKGQFYEVHREVEVNKQKGAIYTLVRRCFHALERALLHHIQRRRSARSMGLQAAVLWQPKHTQTQTYQ